MEKGLKHSVSTRVDKTNSAAAIGSGNLDVFATPSMIALMENASMDAVAAYLPEGSATVGTLVNVVHTRATPMGDIVTAEAVLEEVDGRRLIFSVSAVDSKGEIGKGLHERFIVDTERFLAKL